MEGKPLRDCEYLLHHIELGGKNAEEVHHCLLYDHIANMFKQSHLWINKGKVYLEGKEIKEGYFHVIGGLETEQDVAWSDKDALANGITPKRMFDGMTFKQKAREW